MHRRWITSLPILALLLVASGCRIETTLDAGGGGTVNVAYRASKGDTLDRVKAQFASDNVEITKATIDDEMRVAVALKFKDLTKLNSSKFFGGATFTRAADAKAGTTTVKAVVTAAKPITLPDEQLTYFGKDVTIAITVPGEIVTSNGKTSGQTATWTPALNALLGAKDMPFEVTFKTPAAAADEKGAEGKADEKGAEGKAEGK